MSRKRAIVWLSPLLIWGLFTYWYTNTEGALTQEEMTHYLTRMQQVDQTLSLETLRTFMENDTGKSLIMVNLLDLAENPSPLPGAPADLTARDMLDHYMEFMYPELLARASHPIYAGRAVAPAMDLSGIEGAERWTTGALMRYRSRRDLLDIATNPRFYERHDFKMAALTKTIAFPVESVFHYADPRFMLALLLLSVTALIDLFFLKR
ncbi:MAG: hypothetical protein AAGG55_00865 [Pseudomonadota bacterium]